MHICVGDEITEKNLIITIDGEDVSNRCYEADDKIGYVLCYKRNKKGKFFMIDNTLVKERLVGKVLIICNGGRLW